MHGFIFVTWEQFLRDIYNMDVLSVHRAAIQGDAASIPLESRTYDDAALIAGVTAVSQYTGMPLDMLLQEYGRYFVSCSLIEKKCPHLISDIKSGRDLLLRMRQAHLQMRQVSDAIVPPIFEYESLTQDGLVLTYNSHRKLCPLLRGALEGAAIRCKERAIIYELKCMRMGSQACEFEVYFRRIDNPFAPRDNHDGNAPDDEEKRRRQRIFDDMIYSMLPPQGDGFSLGDVNWLLSRQGMYTRPYLILESFARLHLAGYVVAQPTPDLFHRKYKRIERVGVLVR